MAQIQDTPTKEIRNVFLIGLAALAISAACAQENEAAKQDVVQLQDEWSMVSGSADGYPMPDTMRTNSKRVCKGDETTVVVGGQLLMKAKFTLDPSKKPKTIDYQMIDGFTKGKQQLGIYQLDGIRLSFVSGRPDLRDRRISPAKSAMAARCPSGSARRNSAPLWPP